MVGTHWVARASDRINSPPRAEGPALVGARSCRLVHRTRQLQQHTTLPLNIYLDVTKLYDYHKHSSLRTYGTLTENNNDTYMTSVYTSHYLLVTIQLNQYQFTDNNLQLQSI